MCATSCHVGVHEHVLHAACVCSPSPLLPHHSMCLALPHLHFNHAGGLVGFLWRCVWIVWGGGRPRGARYPCHIQVHSKLHGPETATAALMGHFCVTGGRPRQPRRLASDVAGSSCDDVAAVPFVPCMMRLGHIRARYETPKCRVSARLVLGKQPHTTGDGHLLYSNAQWRRAHALQLHLQSISCIRKLCFDVFLMQASATAAWRTSLAVVCPV